MPAGLRAVASKMEKAISLETQLSVPMKPHENLHRLEIPHTEPSRRMHGSFMRAQCPLAIHCVVVLVGNNALSYAWRTVRGCVRAGPEIEALLAQTCFQEKGPTASYCPDFQGAGAPPARLKRQSPKTLNPIPNPEALEPEPLTSML